MFTQSYNANGASEDRWNAVKVDANGNILVAGYTTVAGQGKNGLVAKYGSTGNLIWTRTYNNPFNSDDVFSGVTADAQGNVSVIGTEQMTATDSNIVGRKYDPNGTLIWTQSYNGPVAGGVDSGSGIAANSVGDLLIAASVATAANGFDIVIAKLAGLNGSYTWSDQVNGAANNNDEGIGIAVDASGRVYASGYSVGASMNADSWVRKYQDNGVNFTASWTRTFNGASNGDDVGWGVAFDSTGALVVAGTEFVTNQDYNMWTRKYDTNGNTVWTQTYGSGTIYNDFALSVAVDAQNNVVVLGHEAKANVTFDIWLRKYDSAGTTRWTQTYNGASDGSDFGFGVTTDSSGFIYAVGSEATQAQSDNGWLRKYNP